MSMSTLIGGYENIGRKIDAKYVHDKKMIISQKNNISTQS
jgi:hypothetical protein